MTRTFRSHFLMGLILLSFTVFCQLTSFSQETDEEAISETVHALFDAMREGDSAKASALFHPEAKMSTVGMKEGQVILREGNAARFFEAIGTPHDEVWDERIWGMDISQDGLIGSAWMHFAFFRGEAYSHCGVNVFTLMKEGDDWKIIAISDSRKKECDIPDEVMSK
ncbi:MAG: nuclear transport factor 2 family protein [Bacteroidota bacterium]